MTITYELGKSLYVNITNRCSNACTFCVRKDEPTINGVDDLWLEKEPTQEEILEDILTRDLDQYDELQYWAVADMTDGSEQKVISFTVPHDTLEKIANGSIVEGQLQSYSTDVWLSPALQ